MTLNARMILTGIVADTPLYLVGAPGGGKTATVTALAKALGRELVTVIGATRDRTDFGGWPRYDEAEKEVKVHPFPWVKQIIEAGKNGILFLDEMNADAEIFKVLLRVLAERYIGDLKFEGYVLGAGNPEELSVSGLNLPPPVANRVIHYTWQVSVSDWVRGMTAGFESLLQIPKLPTQEVVEAKVAEVKALVAAFIDRHPQALHQPNENALHGPWPSPRSWELLARFLGAARALGMDEEVEALGAYGAVGPKGHEFLNYTRSLDLPHPEEVLKNPNKLPKREDALFVTLMAATSYVLEHLDATRWNQAWALLEHVYRSGKVDTAARPAYILARAYRNLSEEKKQALGRAPEALKAFVPLIAKLAELGS